MDLPETFRTTVYLADVEGYPYKEIAEMMGTPVGTVMSRLHRARARLRESLAERAPQPKPAQPRPAQPRPPARQTVTRPAVPRQVGPRAPLPSPGPA